MSSFNLSRFLVEISIWAVPTLFSIVLHEVMHGVVARQLGDDTAERAGRLTLNPISHIDTFGTILLPAMLLLFHLPVFGYAKPVPVDFRRLRNPRSGMIMVAIAGPLTNLVLAILSSIGAHALYAHLGPDSPTAVVVPLIYMLQASVIVNVALGLFNLFPLLPLDGGRVLVGMLPFQLARQFARLERYGMLLLFLLLYSGFFARIINPLIGAATRILL
jgi:Zn-dependent protease